MMERLLPRGACDSHVHIFDPQHPLPGLIVTPDATMDAYRAVQHQTGLERVVLVQANGYRTDNRCMLDALDRLGRKVARGVAVVEADAPLDLLRALEARGIHFHLFPSGYLT